MIGGFENPTEGRVFLGGADVTELPPYKRDVNTVFQSYALFPHLTRREERRVRPGAQEGRQGRGAQARRRGAGARPARPPRQAQARPALRRPAAARRAGPRARQPPARAAARRAARRARPAPAQAAADRAQADPAGHRDHVRARHARSGGGHEHGRHDRGHERRPDRAGGRRGRPLRAPADRVRGQLPRRLEPRRRAHQAGDNGHTRVETHDGAEAARARERCGPHGDDNVRVGVRPEKITLVPDGRGGAGRRQRAARQGRRGRLPRRLDPVRDPRRRRRGAQRLHPEHGRLGAGGARPSAATCSSPGAPSTRSWWRVAEPHTRRRFLGRAGSLALASSLAGCGIEGTLERGEQGGHAGPADPPPEGADRQLDVLQLAAVHRQEGPQGRSTSATAATSSTSRTSTTTTSSTARSASSCRPTSRSGATSSR